MKVDSYAAIIETPEKIETDLLNSPSLDKDRCSPSSDLKSLLKGLERLHSFCHASSGIESIENMKLDLKTKNTVIELFSGFESDLSDWILQKENYLCDLDKYSAFSRDFIHYQFLVQKDHSIAVLLFLNYIKKFSVAPSTALVELFKLRVEETLCLYCYDRNQEQQNSNLEIKKHNVNYLKSMLANEISDLDDSYDDPQFTPDKMFGHESDNSTDVTSKEETEIGKAETLIKEDKLVSNPFENSDEDIYKFQETESRVNPFENSDDEALKIRFRPTKSSSLKSNPVKEFSNCDHCQRGFSNSYNLKVHTVQVHRIFPEGMAIYQCPQCEFVTGSKIGFTRHTSTHLRKKTNLKLQKLSNQRIKCNYCGSLVFNKYSLKRHIKRKHTNVS